jgi:bifunctional non-homologous end joining protein LigD
MSLRQYKRKRHFNRTPEPKGKVASKSGRAFVVQKHHASHRHYDFRLELEGVLKSWAVPKGPSLDPAVKRLAMQVEDHPVEYGSFEGVIPQGQYGGGTVMLWDRGTWEPLGNPHEDYQKGRLKFKLHGKKLRGRWMLVRTGRPTQVEQRQWLLFKERDDQARPSQNGDILEEMPFSVATGRSIEEIAADQDSVWKSRPKADRFSRSRIAARAAQESVPARTRAVGNPDLRSQLRQNYDPRKQEFAGLRLTSPEKVLYPDPGITKLELVNYYYTVADWILPHLKNRPLVLVRCPEGCHKTCFYQKHPPPGSPETLRQIPIREDNKTAPYALVENKAGLLSLAQIAALEIHAWGSRADKLERPDRLIFDLDPDPQVDWGRVVAGARQVREFLQELGLESFLKTTGGKGLHLVVPIERRHDWDECKTFCRRVAEAIVQADPGHYTSNMSKAARTGKIFIDYLRNGRGATAIMPYSTRARQGAPVSTPIAWEELSAQIKSDHFTVRNMARRLAALKHDPWERIGEVRQNLRKGSSILEKLLRAAP